MYTVELFTQKAVHEHTQREGECTHYSQLNGRDNTSCHTNEPEELCYGVVLD